MNLLFFHLPPFYLIFILLLFFLKNSMNYGIIFLENENIKICLKLIEIHSIKELFILEVFKAVFLFSPN
jgi:hypothetical protein